MKNPCFAVDYVPPKATLPHGYFIADKPRGNSFNGILIIAQGLNLTRLYFNTRGMYEPAREQLLGIYADVHRELEYIEGMVTVDPEGKVRRELVHNNRYDTAHNGFIQFRRQAQIFYMLYRIIGSFASMDLPAAVEKNPHHNQHSIKFRRNFDAALAGVTEYRDCSVGEMISIIKATI